MGDAHIKALWLTSATIGVAVLTAGCQEKKLESVRAAPTATAAKNVQEQPADRVAVEQPAISQDSSPHNQIPQVTVPTQKVSAKPIPDAAPVKPIPGTLPVKPIPGTPQVWGDWQVVYPDPPGHQLDSITRELCESRFRLTGWEQRDCHSWNHPEHPHQVPSYLEYLFYYKARGWCWTTAPSDAERLPCVASCRQAFFAKNGYFDIRMCEWRD